MKENPFYRQEAENSTKLWVKLLQFFAAFLTITVLGYISLISFNEVDGPSMEPNFYSDQPVLVSRLHQWFDGTGLGNALGLRYRRGDVVTYKGQEGRQIIKRIYGLPGESIRVQNGVFYINNVPLSEGFAINQDSKFSNEFIIDGGSAITLGIDEFFLVGDNRDMSIDSRDKGPIKKDQMVGKVFFRISGGFGFIGTGKFL